MAVRNVSDNNQGNTSQSSVEAEVSVVGLSAVVPVNNRNKWVFENVFSPFLLQIFYPWIFRFQGEEEEKPKEETGKHPASKYLGLGVEKEQEGRKSNGGICRMDDVKEDEEEYRKPIEPRIKNRHAINVRREFVSFLD